ncbi:hypothetical protein V2J09_020950 [Rumex salicifolius]
MWGIVTFHLRFLRCAMDYSMGVAKMMCKQLKETEQPPRELTQSTVYAFGAIGFQRVWVQGIIVKSYPDDDSRFLLDDGSAVIELKIKLDTQKRHLDPGKYVMVVGAYTFREDEPIITVHKLVDLSMYPDREAMWYLEVIEACKMFYLPLPEEAEAQNSD